MKGWRGGGGNDWIISSKISSAKKKIKYIPHSGFFFHFGQLLYTTRSLSTNTAQLTKLHLWLLAVERGSACHCVTQWQQSRRGRQRWHCFTACSCKLLLLCCSASRSNYLKNSTVLCFRLSRGTKNNLPGSYSRCFRCSATFQLHRKTEQISGTSD